MKKCIFSLVVVLVVGFTQICFAQTPEITNGLSYLNSVQNVDGSWGGDSSASEQVPATLAALETLQQLELTTDSSYFSASSWLQNQNLTTSDQIAGRIQTLLAGGADLDILLSYLDMKGKRGQVRF